MSTALVLLGELKGNCQCCGCRLFQAKNVSSVLVEDVCGECLEMCDPEAGPCYWLWEAEQRTREATQRDQLE